MSGLRLGLSDNPPSITQGLLNPRFTSLRVIFPGVDFCCDVMRIVTFWARLSFRRVRVTSPIRHSFLYTSQKK